MALLDSAHRVSMARTPSKPLTERNIHPAISLLGGFGLIIGTATLVHLIFKLVV